MLEGLAEALQEKNNSCIPFHEHSVANCCIHAVQLQLKNAVVSVFGEGGLDKTNMMQTLHSAHDLQKAIDQDEWSCMLWKSTEFAHSFDAAEVANNQAIIDRMTGDNRKCNTFCQSCTKVLVFHDKFRKNAPVDPATLTEHKDTMHAKIVAPILTHWWVVGAGVSCLFECYLPLHHVCQSVINSYSGNSKANRIASGLCSLMTDQVNFIDMCLVCCFNKACIHPDLRWPQACINLTNKHGFQSHNISIRHCVMEIILESMLFAPKMQDCHDVMSRPRWRSFQQAQAFH